ncbi:MAG: hypothetical protein HYT79_10385 [Elusimicrobia bacterium]|nr:hypothetical protein [Elusimicrobiota bacterium]
MVHEHPFLLSPDESVIAVTTDPEVLRLLGVDGKKSINVPIPSPLLEFVFSPDGKKLAVVMENESLAIVDSATGKMNLIDDKGPCSGLAWSSDSLRLYYAIVDTRMVDDVPIKFFEIKKFETGLLTKKSIDAGKIKISKDRGSPVHPPDSSAQPLPREAPADKGIPEIKPVPEFKLKLSGRLPETMLQL